MKVSRHELSPLRVVDFEGKIAVSSVPSALTQNPIRLITKIESVSQQSNIRKDCREVSESISTLSRTYRTGVTLRRVFTHSVGNCCLD